MRFSGWRAQHAIRGVYWIHMDTLDQEPAVTPTPKKNGDGIGSVIGIIVIILLLVAGGIYYFTVGIGREEPKNDAAVAGDEAALGQQSASTNLADIKTDVEATDLSGLDEASADFESELEAQ